MKRLKILVFFVIFAMLVSTLPAYARTINVNSLLKKLSNPKLTSYQKINYVDKYKGQTVKGSGRIKDVLKRYGTENEVMLYVRRTMRGMEYEITLAATGENLHRVRKGQRISFSGTFTGMAFDRLSFEDVKINAKPWWWPF